MRMKSEDVSGLIFGTYWIGVPIAYGYFGTLLSATPLGNEAYNWLFAAPFIALTWPASLLVWLGAWLA